MELMAQESNNTKIVCMVVGDKTLSNMSLCLGESQKYKNKVFKI